MSRTTTPLRPGGAVELGCAVQAASGDVCNATLTAIAVESLWP